MLRKFPTLKNPSDLKTSFSLELCLFIKTSWSFGAPKIPQPPFCQKVRKIEMTRNLSEIPGNHPQRNGSIEKDTKFLGGFVFPMKKSHTGIATKAPPSIRPYPGCYIHLPSKAGAMKDAGPRSRQIEKNKIQRTKGNLKSSGLTGVDQCK